MTQLTIGSLFSGYGGLDLAVTNVLDAKVVWHCEYDEAPSKILQAHYPEIPNYGDVTKIDFAAIPQVDILTGGFPCQDLSNAGKRAGLKEGTRSGLWSYFLKAIEIQKPKLVVIENVRGLLNAEATIYSDLEPCEWCVGNGSTEPTLRALGAVLGQLATIGYGATWQSVRASDAGAAHGRFRVFIIAYPECNG
jgi:DNA (cytosine-5)-methyltransferase 1